MSDGWGRNGAGANRSEGWVYPKPPELDSTTQKASADYKVWKNGQMFVLKGGPHDGALLKLFPGPYPDRPDSSGWDEVTFDGAVYRRPKNVDPYMRRAGKANKKKTNVPHMAFVASEVVPVAA